MSDCKKCIRCMKGVVPPAGKVFKIIWISAWITLGTLFAAVIISSMVSSAHWNYSRMHFVKTQSEERADKIIDDLNRMKAALRAFMAWYTDSLEDIRLGIKLFNGRTGEVIGEFTARPSEPVEAHPYTVNRDRADRITKPVKIARDDRTASTGGCILTVMDEGRALYVGYKLEDNELSTEVKKILAAKSRLYGLLGSDGNPATTKTM